MSVVIFIALKKWVGKGAIAPRGQELFELPCCSRDLLSVLFNEDFALATHCQNQVSFCQFRIEYDTGKGGQGIAVVLRDFQHPLIDGAMVVFLGYTSATDAEGPLK